MTDEQLEELQAVLPDLLKKLLAAGVGVEVTGTTIDLQIPVKVAYGGTGTDTLTGYVKGAGKGPMTASVTVPMSDLDGVLPVKQGGTGLVVVEGYLHGNGDTLEGRKLIPADDVSGLGDLSLQDAKNVTITGGSIAASTVKGDISGSATSITSILPVAKGGTGLQSLDDLKKAINSASAGDNSDITSLSGLTTPLSVKQGGLGEEYISGYVKGQNGEYVGIRKIDGVDITGDITGRASNVTGVVSVANGGTGSTSLTGYLVGTGNAIVGITEISSEDIKGDIAGNAANVSGVVGMANGGTGLKSVTGYLVGDGETFRTVTKVPAADVENLGSIASQDANAVNISGGEAKFDTVGFGNLAYSGRTHNTYTMTSNMPLMHPTGFIEIMIGSRLCKVPYYDY